MANLGTIGRHKGRGVKGATSSGWTFLPLRPRLIVCGGSRLYYGGNITTDGSPAQPCLEFSDCNALFRFRWAVKAGTRTLSIKVANVTGLTPYPTVTIRANPAIGVNADVVGTALAGTAWQTIGPLSVSPSSDGVLLVELYSGGVNANNLRPVRWDSVSDSTGRTDMFTNWFNLAPVIDINELINPAVTRVFGSVG